MIAIEQLIKIIIGVFVFVIVVLGLYFVFKNYIIDFFTGGNSTGAFLALIW